MPGPVYAMSSVRKGTPAQARLRHAQAHLRLRQAQSDLGEAKNTYRSNVGGVPLLRPKFFEETNPFAECHMVDLQ